MQPGAESNPANHPQVLQWKNTTTLDRPECIRRLGAIGRRMVHANTICTANRVNVGVCSGDAGGALTTRARSPVLIGIFSWGLDCGRGLPDVYARVFPHLQFIRTVMQA